MQRAIPWFRPCSSIAPGGRFSQNRPRDDPVAAQARRDFAPDKHQGNIT